MRSPVRMFPKSWKTDVVVLRGGGRDKYDNPLPTSEIVREGVLIAPRSTAEMEDFSEVESNRVALYDDNADGFRYVSTDRVRVPDGARMAGDWRVVGRTQEWPMGNEVVLERA